MSVDMQEISDRKQIIVGKFQKMKMVRRHKCSPLKITILRLILPLLRLAFDFCQLCRSVTAGGG
jgi:hypothetical protein